MNRELDRGIRPAPLAIIGEGEGAGIAFPRASMAETPFLTPFPLDIYDELLRFLKYWSLNVPK